MKIEIAEHSRMSESGSSLLRLIQNQDIPLLDLIVRESIQNSLDATNGKNKCVNVDITVGEFRSVELNRYFERIERGLNEKFPLSKGNYSFISFRDSNTVGLTGPVRYDDVRDNVFGNLLKLVYEICKPQQNEGAGGSWGLGKTIYFRLGIGLVLYYSRIFQDGKYQSRLAACLVEDETKDDSLIPHTSGVKRGIAWWGKLDSTHSKTTIPLDSEKEIEKILSVFGLELYGPEETGTTVIIPYVDKKLLLAEVYANNESAEQKPYWVNSIEEYIKVAIQKWYAPRLSNALYPYGAYLSVRINGEKVKVSEMLPMFRLIRDLYILSQDGMIEDTSLVKEQNMECKIESIDLRGVLNSTSAGRLAYGRFSRAQMLMDPPDNQKTPYQQISNIFVNMDGGNGPIIMFTRKPGMIVGYDYDSTWTHRMPKSTPDEFIIGLFVANSENILKNIVDIRTGMPMSLEEYIRQGEKADHASWTDRNIQGNNPRIISNIQKNIINKIRKQYTEVVTENTERQNIGLGHALANLLLPSEDFGGISTLPARPSDLSENIPKSSRGKKSSLQIIGQPEYQSGKVSVNFELNLVNKVCELVLQIITDFKRYEADLWEKEIGKRFPVIFSQMKISQISTSGKGRPAQCALNLDEKCIRSEDEKLVIEYRASNRFKQNCYISIIPHNFKGKVRGKITFTVSDPRIRGSLEIKEIKL
mgnify:CR=1 FL=1